MNYKIVVRFTRPGFHMWPDAPATRGYLRNMHRHLFYVEVAMQVNHDDREVEFHDLLSFCEIVFPSGDFGTRSCEQLATGLLEEIKNRYLNRKVSVSVFEDNEVGAIVE